MKFANLDEAQSWVTGYLCKNLRTQAVEAGTASRDVHCSIDDRIIQAANGVPLFLERIVNATLAGYPEPR